MREESRLRVFENKVPKRISWPKKHKVTGEWRKLHNEKLEDLYCLPNIYQIKKNEISRACSMYGGEKRCIQGFGRET
jgi:hypothetical protein